MKTSSNTILALAGGFALMFSVSVMAADDAKDKAGVNTKEVVAVVQEVMAGAKQAELANALIGYGRQQRSALALINAVQILDGISAKVLPPGESGATGKAYDRSALLAEAESFAGDKPEIKELIKDVGAAKSKGYYVPTCYYDYICGPYGCYYRWYCY